MNRVKILVLLATVALLALLPVGLFAQQPEAPHRFFGTATMADGSLAPDGTVVSAWVGDAEAGTAVVESSFQAAFYLLDVTPAIGGASYVGQMVTFLVDGVSTGDSVAWVTRTSQELNLTAMAAMMEEGAGLAIGLFEESHSGQTGRATFKEVGDDLQVDLSLGSGALWSELAHIHSGQCNESGGDTLGGVVHALTSFVGGSGASSITLEGVTLASVQDGDHAVNVHSADDAGTYTACGNIPAADASQMLPMMMAAGPDTEAITESVKTALVGDALFTVLLSGRAGRNGLDGVDGDDGLGGANGRDGVDGRNGTNGANGANAVDGANGTDGVDGADGRNGTSGAAGEDGGGGLGIVALILAIVALLGVGGAFAMSRRS